MVNTQANAEGKYLKPEHVEASTNKFGIIVNEGQYIDTKNGKAFEITVSFNKILKNLFINQETNKNLADVWGYDSSNWVEKRVEFHVEKTKNSKGEVKKKLLAYPVGNDGKTIINNEPIEDSEIVQ